jgi:hypothetical protein
MDVSPDGFVLMRTLRSIFEWVCSSEGATNGSTKGTHRDRGEAALYGWFGPSHDPAEILFPTGRIGRPCDFGARASRRGGRTPSDDTTVKRVRDALQDERVAAMGIFGKNCCRNFYKNNRQRRLLADIFGAVRLAQSGGRATRRKQLRKHRHGSLEVQ